MRDKIQLAFIGVGNMGQMAHLKNYDLLRDECDIVAITEPDEGRADRVARRYGIGKHYRDLESMLKNHRVDAFVASQPFNRHGLILPELLNQGVPVFIEKPISLSLEVGKQILEAEATGGGTLVVGYHKRSDPATDYALKVIRSGELGGIRYIRITMPPGDFVANGRMGVVPPTGKVDLERDPEPVGMSQADLKRYRSFVNYYIHQVNLLRYLLGESYRITYADPSEIILTTRSRSGIPSVIEMEPFRTSIDWQESAFIGLEKGWIQVAYPAPLASFRPGKVSIYKDFGEGSEETPHTLEPQLPYLHAMYCQARNFLRTVRGEAAPRCGAAEAVEDLEIAQSWLDRLIGARESSEGEGNR